MREGNFFVIHGSFASPFSNWIPWLRAEIERSGNEVYTPDFPSGVGFQTYENWDRLLRAYLDAGLLNTNTTIFAHSIAPVFVCKFLITHKIRVKRLIFVCGFNNYFGVNDEYDAVNGSMYVDNLADVKKYCDEIICLYSNNDPYVKFEVEKDFADKIATGQEIIEGGKHLNSEAGYNKFEKILEYI